MSIIIKIIRVTFFLALYFSLCVVAIATVFQNWAPDFQMLFVLLGPIALVWWGEKRRAKRNLPSQPSNVEAISERLESATKRSSLPPPKGRFEKPVDRDQKPIHQRETSESLRPTPTSFVAPAAPAESAHISGVSGQDSVPRQDNAIVHEGMSSVSELSEIDNAKEISKIKSAEKKATRRTGWVPSSKIVKIAGRDINGMVYVGTAPRLYDDGYRNKCRAYIDPTLPVAREGTDKLGNGLPYWPGYSEIPPQCRATYLDWLASGRSDPSYDPGYMFIFFYGLERRFFLDHPHEDEKWEILQEVRQLKTIYPDNGSVQRYLGEFIQVAQISLKDETMHEPVFDHRGWELPLSVKFVIGSRVGRGDLLSSDWVLSWLMCHPERRLRTPATRCAEEFRGLFKLRFEARFPDGLKVAKPRKILKPTYQAASSEFEGKLELTADGVEVPDISDLRKPVEIAQEIADEVMGDLDKLSRYLGRNPNGRGSVEAQALLPHELWEMFPSEEMARLKTWAAEVVGGGGLVPVLEVVERLEGHRPEKLSKRTLTGSADALARIGYGLAPDPRFALRSPKLDEPVFLFELGEAVAQLEEVSDDYRAALIEAALGTFVAHADGKITEGERTSLLAKAMGVEGLRQQEYRRLAANLEWMLAVAPDLTLLRRKLKETGPEALASIRSALIAAAHADGVIQAKEVAGIEKVYKALGLDPTLVYSDLHAGDPSDGPVRVRAAQIGTAGEAIPDETPSGSPKLDAARIAAIQSDTARVSSVLGDIFDDAPEEPVEAAPKGTVLGGLDVKHSRLVQALIAQDHWSEAAFEELCREAGLLASGTIEDINEWAYDTYDEALLEEYDGYEVSPNLAEQLREKFEEETLHVEP